MGAVGALAPTVFLPRPEIIHICVPLFLPRPEVIYIHAPTLFSPVGRQCILDIQNTVPELGHIFILYAKYLLTTSTLTEWVFS